MTRDVALDGTGLAVDHLRGKSATLGKLGDGAHVLATILTGADNVVVAFGADADGWPVQHSIQTADATLLQLESAVWDGDGNLTVTGNANATGDMDIAIFVTPPSPIS